MPPDRQSAGTINGLSRGITALTTSVRHRTAARTMAAHDVTAPAPMVVPKTVMDRRTSVRHVREIDVQAHMNSSGHSNAVVARRCRDAVALALQDSKAAKASMATLVLTLGAIGVALLRSNSIAVVVQSARRKSKVQ